MAHNLDFSNGRANMAYRGPAPWHGLGQALEAGLSIEEWAKAAGMEYEVERAIVKYDNGTTHEFPGKHVLFRSDTHKPLGIVSDGYKIVQPMECLEFFRDLCADQGMTLETAGVLKDGALYWALAKTSDSLTIGKNDVTERYVLMSTSADGTQATNTRETGIRVVCNNTLSAALSGKGAKATKTRHNTEFDAKATKEKMGLISTGDTWKNFCETMRELSEKAVSEPKAEAYFAELLRPAGERAKPRAELKTDNLADLLARPFGGSVNVSATDKAPVERAIRGFAEVMNSYNNAPGACPGTAYGLIQGVTHYIDHVRGNSNDKRLTSAWFGQGDALKLRAVELAKEL